MIQSAFLSLTLFLLTADLLFVGIGGIKIKYGYFLILGMWLLAPQAMLAHAKDAVRRVPAYVYLLAIPTGIAVAASIDLPSSLGWALWLLFDALTIVTVYAFLRTWAFDEARVQAAAAWSLGLVALFGFVQFVFIYGLGKPIFDPQIHLDVYRLNGLSGWPHFLNIDAFLLLPIVLTGKRIGVAAAVILALLAFVLAQSTAKIGWVLLGALVVLLLVFHRTAQLKKIGLYAIPIVLAMLFVPIPSSHVGAPAMTGAEKIVKFGTDFGSTKSVRDRRLINEMGLSVWLRHPWFGVGPRAYDEYVFTRFDVELPGVNKLDAENEINAKNENIWIEFLAEAGIFFTLCFAALVVRALWVRRLAFANTLHLGAWISLVLYYTISGQVSQSGLLTLVYAVFGIYFHASSMGERSRVARGAPREGG